MADKEAKLNIDLEDEVMSQLVATDHGEIISNRLRAALNLPAKQSAKQEATTDEGNQSTDKGDQ